MKKLFFILLLILIFTGYSTAQWTEQTSGISTLLYSVSAVDNNIVWACGAGGKVLRTVNSGDNWSVTASPNSSLDLHTIQGIDALTALVGGSDSTAGYAFKTVDGGATWSQTFMQPGGFINSVDLFNGFPVCGLLGDPVGGRWSQFVSYDFGSTWDSTGYYNPAPPGEGGWNNSFFQATPSFFSYYGTNNTKVYQPFANGTILTHPTPGLTNSYAIWGNDNSRLMTGGDNIMLYTTDGGFSWTNVNALGTGDIGGIVGAGSNWYYVRGSSVYYSPNDGGTWFNNYTATGTYYHIALSPYGKYMWAVRDNGGISRNLFDPALPVELTSFISTINGSNVTLNWSTSREVNNTGFEIERSEVRAQTSEVWTNIGFVNGNGNTAENHFYEFTDRGLNQGKYNYRLKQIDFNGNFNYHNLSNEVIIGLPGKFNLSQNFPNPFNPSTKISYELPFDGNVSLKVFDMTGKEVMTLVNEFRSAGYYTVTFSGVNLSTGVYIYRISADANGQSFSSEKRMVLVK
ncbi:MAG: T9SS type A sorting domain-containing protein [Ignavibacteriae bacterium]|nr:T9SS type A sorting domain-containing protein [Ignavibacteriota bacterium]